MELPWELLMAKLATLGHLFPCSEPQLYQALCAFRTEGCKAGRIQGCIEAVTFCRFVFNIQSLQESVDSKRCRGVARGSPINKPAQSSPLRVPRAMRPCRWSLRR
eukprot:s2538_g19.t1